VILVRQPQLERKDGSSWVFCGKTICVSPSAFVLSNQKALESFEHVPIAPDRRKLDDSPVTEEERSAYRSAVGSLNYLTLWTRGDFQAAVSFAAQRTTKACVRDLKVINKLIDEVRSTSEVQLTFRRGVVDISTATIVAWGDSGFANAEDSKSQCGVVLALTNRPDDVIACQFQHCLPMEWRSATIKRVVRSTLAAESYAVSACTESAQVLQFLLSAILSMVDGSLDLRAIEMGRVSVPVGALADSESLSQSSTLERSLLRAMRQSRAVQLTPGHILPVYPGGKQIPGGITLIINNHLQAPRCWVGLTRKALQQTRQAGVRTAQTQHHLQRRPMLGFKQQLTP